MAAEKEIERMVVRLVGDGSMYKTMMQEARQVTNEVTKDMDGRLRDSRGRFVVGQEKLRYELAQTNNFFKKAQVIAGHYGEEMTRVGKSLSLRVSLPLKLLGIAAIKVGSDFESGFAGVKKTISATDSELAVMREGFKKLLTEIPATSTELLGIGEAAGQLGIANDKVLDFTKTIAMLGVTTNLSSEEGAAALAKFANIMGMSQDKFSNLGSTIVALGNASATTEKDIMMMSMRLAGAGSTVGMSVPEVTALATALSEVGIEAEMGGSALSTFMLDITSEVANAGDKVRAFAKISGVSVEEFSRAWREDAAGALVKLLDGLKGLDKESKIKAIQEMGVDGIRMTDAILRSSNAVDTLKKSMSIANKAFEDNSALANEAKQRFETFASQVVILTNKIKLLLGEAFEIMRPTLIQIGEGITNLTEWFRGLSDETKKTIVIVTAITAALGPTLLAVGALSKALAILKIAMIQTGIGAAVVALGILVAALLQSESAMAEVKEILAPLKDLWAELGKLWKEIQPTVMSLADAVVSGLKVAFESMTPVLKGTVFILAEYIKSVVMAITKTAEFINSVPKLKIPNIGGKPGDDTGLSLGKVAKGAMGPLGMLMGGEDTKAKGDIAEAKSQMGGLAAAIRDRARAIEETGKKQAEANNVQKEARQMDLQAESARLEMEKEKQKKIQETIDLLREEANTIGMTAQELVQYELAQLGVLEGSKEWNEAMKESNRLEALRGQMEQEKKDAEKEQQRDDALRDTIKSLKEQVATYGMNRKELALYQAAQLGASDAQKAVIASLHNELTSKEAATKATEDAKKATDDAREAEKRFQESIKGIGIEGVGRGIEAMARIQESRQLRAAGRDNNPAKAPPVLNPAELRNNPEFVAKVNESSKRMDELLIQIAENTYQTAQKEPVEIKSAGIGG